MRMESGPEKPRLVQQPPTTGPPPPERLHCCPFGRRLALEELERGARFMKELEGNERGGPPLIFSKRTNSFLLLTKT